MTSDRHDWTWGTEPPSTPGAPPGWYPDPLQHLPYRWWDGSEWASYAALSPSPGPDAVQWDPLSTGDIAAERQPGLPGIGLAFIAFGVALGLSLLSIVILRAMGKPGGLPVELVVSELILWVPLVAGVLYVSRHRGTRSLRADYGLRFRPSDLVFGLLASFVARIMSAVVILPVVIVHPVFRAPDQTEFSKFTGSAADWLALAAVTCVGAPLVEELFFRGLLQTRLVGKLGPVTGIAIASVLFGAAHLIGWVGPVTLVYALAIAGAGMVLGTVRHLTGRLGTSMVTHAIFNAQALVALAVALNWTHNL